MIQKICVGAGSEFKVPDWGGLDKDKNVLNVRVSCNTIKGLNMPAQLDPMRPVQGSKNGATLYLIGVSSGKKHQPFPMETARVPSLLSAQKGAVDICALSGHPSAHDFVEVCVVFSTSK